MFSARARAVKMTASSSALRRVAARAGGYSYRLSTAPGAAVAPPQQAAGGGAGGSARAGAVRGILTTSDVTDRRALSTAPARATTAAPTPAPAAATAPRYVLLFFFFLVNAYIILAQKPFLTLLLATSQTTTYNASQWGSLWCAQVENRARDGGGGQEKPPYMQQRHAPHTLHAFPFPLVCLVSVSPAGGPSLAAHPNLTPPPPSPLSVPPVSGVGN